MPLATYSSTWGTTLANALVFPGGNPTYASAKLSFAQSIAIGITLAFVGATVKTVDAGQYSVAVVGSGTGVGLTGFLTPSYSSTFSSLCVSKFQNFTTENQIVMNAIATTWSTALSNTQITTTHPNVTAGTGTATLTPPSAGAITSQLILNAIPPVNSNPVYSKWPDYCDIIGKAIFAGSGTLTGTVQISGIITPPVVVVPTGAGSGTIG